MPQKCSVLCLFWLISTANLEIIFAQQQKLPGQDAIPYLRLETGGPRSNVTGLAFSSGGERLYAVGWDKLVQIWDLQAESGKFHYNPAESLRVPIGAGPQGQLFALAVSDDGKWLATAGLGASRELTAERGVGWMRRREQLSPEAHRDLGTVFVFNTETGAATLLRDHENRVLGLSFVTGSNQSSPLLISIANGKKQAETKLCLWNVERQEVIASLEKEPPFDAVTRVSDWPLLPELKRRPSLVAWQYGKTEKEVRTGFVIGDKYLRIWDAASKQVSRADTKKHGMANDEIHLLTRLPSSFGRDLVTAAIGGIGGWAVPVGPDNNLQQLSDKHYVPGRGDPRLATKESYPAAATFVPGALGDSGHFAFIKMPFNETSAAKYSILILKNDAGLSFVSEVSLPWASGLRQPIITASKDGKRIAVAGSETKDIEIYEFRELLSRSSALPQRISNPGLRCDNALFVRDDDRLGIELKGSWRNEINEPQSETLFFDLGERKISTDKGKWKPSPNKSNDIQGWSVVEDSPGQAFLKKPNGESIPLKLGRGYRLTTYSICPASLTCPVTLVAVASEAFGQPTLQLFHGQTGELLRHYIGHIERIRSLSFSDDGRMLISASDDRTVCVWTTVDLAERNLGKRSMIPDLNVQLIGNQLLVESAAEASELRKGDEVVGISRGGEAIAINAIKDFYFEVSQHVPGQIAELTIRRNGRVQQIRCPVVQAIDEGKPLFTLFIIPDEKRKEWEWIGWNPMGPFDYHGDRISKMLGWHFNTGDVHQPAKFAVADEYRETLLRRNLLSDLIRNQTYVTVVTPPTEMRISFGMRDQDGIVISSDYDDTPQINDRETEIVASVSGIRRSEIREFIVEVHPITTPNAKPHIYTMKLPEDGLKSGNFDWSAGLREYPWTRGDHLLRFVVKIDDQMATHTGRMTFRPAPPAIVKWKPDAKWSEAWNQETVTVDAIVKASSEPAIVQVILEETAGLPHVAHEFSVAAHQELIIKQTVKVGEGQTQIELISWNSNAPPERRTLESDREVATIQRKISPTAPKITFDGIESLAGKRISPQENDAHTYRTSESALRLRGNINAAEFLTNADVAVVNAHEQFKNETVLNRFVTNTVKAMVVDERIHLKPGLNSIVVSAAVGDVSNEIRLSIDYQPALPSIVSFKVEKPELVAKLPSKVSPPENVFYEDFHAKTITLTAQLNLRADSPFQLAIRRNDIPVADNFELKNIDVVAVDANIRRLTATVQLERGKNSFSLYVQNQWSPSVETAQVEAKFLNPPVMLSVAAKTELIAESLDLDGSLIRSTSPLRAIELYDETQQQILSRNLSIKEGPDKGSYALLPTDIRLATGQHKLRLSARNDDGETLVPQLFQVEVKQKLSPPTLQLVTPPPSNTTSEVVTLEYRVESEVPARIHVENKNGKQLSDTVEKVAPGKTHRLQAKLNEGVNTIVLTASNEGGNSRSVELHSSYVKEPATIDIQTVGDVSPKWVENEKSYVVDKVSNSRVKIRGTINTAQGNTFDRRFVCRILVNSFMSSAENIKPDPTDPNRGTFSADITLVRPRNKIKIELLDRDSKSTPTVLQRNVFVNCENPEHTQDLYLLLLGTGDEDALRNDARRFLRVTESSTTKAGRGEIWKSDIFEVIHPYFATNVDSSKAHARLNSLISQIIAAQRKRQRGRALVVIYHQGQIELDKSQLSFTLLTKTAGPAGSADGMESDYLQESLVHTPGAHLVFLDLNQSQAKLSALELWPRAPQLGIMVSNWVAGIDQPEDTRLISALERIFPEARNVKQLAESFSREIDLVQKRFPNSIESRNLLGNIEDATIRLD